MTTKAANVLHLIDQGVRIISAIDGFRRAGMAHSKEPTEHPAGRFTEEQLAELVVDPNIIIQPVTIKSDETAKEITLEQRMKMGAEKVIIWLADSSDETRTEALHIEQAKGDKARKSVLKALGAE